MINQYLFISFGLHGWPSASCTLSFPELSQELLVYLRGLFAAFAWFSHTLICYWLWRRLTFCSLLSRSWTLPFTIFSAKFVFDFHGPSGSLYVWCPAEWLPSIALRSLVVRNYHHWVPEICWFSCALTCGTSSSLLKIPWGRGHRSKRLPSVVWQGLMYFLLIMEICSRYPPLLPTSVVLQILTHKLSLGSLAGIFKDFINPGYFRKQPTILAAEAIPTGMVSCSARQATSEFLECGR